MKVTIIANSSNGLYLFRRHLISALLEQGHEVFALTPFDTDAEKLEQLGVKLIETAIDRRGTNPIRDLSLLKTYHSIIRKIKPDLVITYTIKANVYGGMVCRALKIPYAVNITGLGTAFEGAGWLKRIAVLLNKIALKKSKVVFFENSSDRDSFVSNGIVDINKTHVLHGAGVDTDHFSYLAYPDNAGFRFLFIGRVMREKGIDELLESMKRLVMDGMPCSLDILGLYEENYKEKIEDAEKAGWLRYHGSQPDVRPFIAECDCFVLPSYHEGMANTNLECASSGRPLITSNIPGCREAVVENKSGFLCEAKNAESLYQAMRKMIAQPKETRKKMGVLGREHMKEAFEKKKVIQETMDKLFE